MQEFTGFDIFIILVALISLLMGFMRGILKEIMAIIAWVGAGLIAYFSYPYVVEKLDQLFEKSSTVTVVVSIAVVFLTALAVISLFNMMLMDNFRGFRKGGVDRSLGALFGLLRAAVIVSFIHFAVVMLFKGGDEPDWFAKGKTYRLTQMGSDAMKGMADTFIEKIKVVEGEKGRVILEFDQKGREALDDAIPERETEDNQGFEELLEDEGTDNQEVPDEETEFGPGSEQEQEQEFDRQNGI